MTVVLKDTEQNNTRKFKGKDAIEKAEEQKQKLIDLAGADSDNLVIETSANHDENAHGPTEVVDEGEAEVVDAEPVDTPSPEELSQNPIGFLRDVNDEFVNTIKGTAAISKRGFRFIQREFEISTESEVVQWSEDPLGCVVWAKAELEGGYSAEAHGEGYQFESGVGDNEFVRYADTRAKNRALSDLTSAGALAVSELEVDNDG